MHSLDEAWNASARLIAATLDRTVDGVRGIDSIRRRWASGRAHLMPYFDELGRLVMRVPSIQGSTSDTKTLAMYWDVALRDLEEIIESVRSSFPPHSVVWCVSTDVLAKDICGHLSRLPSASLVSNRVGSYIPDPTREGKYIQPDTKVTSYLKISTPRRSCHDALIPLLRSPSAREEYADFVIKVYSRLLTRCKHGGQEMVCLSINPLDILTSSVFTAGGWRSCHHLFDGEFRTGCISFLVDPTVAVAFAYTSEIDAPLGIYGNVRVLPKLWRQIVRIYPREGHAYFTREYPTRVPLFSMIARHLAVRVLSSYAGLVPPKMDCTDPHVDIRAMKIDELVLLPYESAGLDHISDDELRAFPDVWSYHDATSAKVKLRGAKWAYSYVQGGTRPLNCVVCGELRSPDTDSMKEDGPVVTGSLICRDCEVSTYKCASCGQLMFDSDAHQDPVDGKYYCHGCWVTKYGRCETCGCWYPLAELHSLSGGLYLCAACSKSATKCRICGTSFLTQYARRLFYYICNEDIHMDDYTKILSTKGAVCQSCAFKLLGVEGVIVE